MDKLIKFCIERKSVTVAISLFVLLLGLSSYYFMPRQEMPDTSSPAVQITTLFPGASAKTVEEQVTKKIEDKVAMLDGVHYLSSVSYDNVSVVAAVLEFNVDYDKEWDKLRTLLDNLQKEMPEGVRNFDIDTDLVQTNDLILVFHGANYDAARLKGAANHVKSRLEQIEGVKSVELFGEKKHRVSIRLNMAKLNQMKLSITDIMNLIRAQNTVIPIGSIEASSGKIGVNMPKALERQEDFQNIVIAVDKTTGAMTKLKDVAEISFTQKSSDRHFLKDGESAIMLGAKFNQNQNIVLLGERIQKEINALKSEYSDELHIDEMVFQPKDVEASVNNFILSLLQGIFFVIVVIFVGMGYRNALVVSISIPMSIAATFLFMSYYKIQLHQVSISALIIALGMLVDNAIVICDAVQEHINSGMEKRLAAFHGAKEQMIPIFTSTLTTLAAFSPLISLPGEAGEFLSSLPVIIIVALSASFFAAIFVIPALTATALVTFTPKNNIIDRFSALYEKIFENNVKYSKSLILGVILVLGASIFAFVKFVDIKMFPYVDKDIVYLNIGNDITGNIDNTRELALKAQALLGTQEEITESYISVGGSLPRFYMTQDFMFPTESNAQIFAKFDLSKTNRYRTREDFKFALQTLFDGHFKNGTASVRMLEIKIPGPNIELRAYSDDHETLRNVSDQIYEYLQSLDTTSSVQIEKPNDKYQYTLDIDDEKLIRAGLTRYDVQLQLNLALSGMEIAQLNNGADNYDIFLASDVADIEDLKNVMLQSRITNQKTPLRAVATVGIKKESDAIRRYDRKNMIYISSNIIPHIGTSVVQNALEEYLRKLDTEGVSFHFGGDSQTTSKYLKGLVSASLLAIGMIYIILLVQFNSLIKPLIVMATVVLAMIGIILALVLTKTNFTFTVGLGAASLMGVVVNNGILLLEYIDRAKESGMNVLEACRSSVKRRMRPILLSSITTIFGLIPLIFANSSFFTPMAIALTGGLLLSTFTTVTVIPVIYYMVYRSRQNAAPISTEH